VYQLATTVVFYQVYIAYSKSITQFNNNLKFWDVCRNNGFPAGVKVSSPELSTSDRNFTCCTSPSKIDP